MLRDVTTVPLGSVVSADICIIGSGPAALTLAAGLERAGRSVVILEAGRNTSQPALPPRELEFESSDFATPSPTRGSGVGGTAREWDLRLPGGGFGARLLPLDAIDFERREWVPNSGWPFGARDLEPYWRKAARLCGLRTLDRHPGGPRPPNSDSLVLQVDRVASRCVFTRDLPTRLSAAATTTIITGAPVSELLTDATGSTVERAAVRTPDGRHFTVRARRFVVAAGAIETARLLLASNEAHPAGLGNAGNVVGRYYMDHPYVIAGFVTPRPGTFAGLEAFDVRRSRGAFATGRFRLSEATLRRERILNSGFTLQPRPDPAFAAAMQSASAILRRKCRKPAAVTTLLRRADILVVTAAGLGLVQRTGRPTLQGAGWSRLPGNRRRIGHFAVILQPEQAPNPNNRVGLSERLDSGGMPLPRLAWRWSEEDVDSIRRSSALFAAEVERMGFGTFEAAGPKLEDELRRAGLDHQPVGRRPDPSLLMPAGAHHHLGTTRMSADPAHGVVDAQCRVHGVSNLFIAGGSVFTTGGFANPTLTIIALALRLADHLSGLDNATALAPGTHESTP